MNSFPKRKTRGESFLGIHFDFHADNDTPQVGGSTTAEMIESIVNTVHPDFVQTDCKGHPGNSSYPTKVGNRAKGLAEGSDSLRIWREVTEKAGVALYVHYSGVWDKAAVDAHPEWARTDERGEPDADGITSVFGSYVDELLIPQLLELAGEYRVDGAWVDGDCWAVRPDYAPQVLKQFEVETGLQLAGLPAVREDPAYAAFMAFQREAFWRYVRRYTDAVHKRYPDFQIASNWSFSSYMPEPVSVGVDFLSGDYPMNNSVSWSRFESRCLSLKGKPWDLMAWGFSGDLDKRTYSTKTPLQLMQESAQVLAQGGGFQVYFNQNSDGSVKAWEMDVMAQVARFCRARQDVCFRSSPIPQVAILNNGREYYQRSRNVLAADKEAQSTLRGGLSLLLDGQFSVDVLLDSDDFSAYPLVVLPDCGILEENCRQRLLRHVEKGGRLLLAGPNAAALFPEYGRSVEERQTGLRYLCNEGFYTAFYGSWVKATETEGTFGELFAGNGGDFPSSPAAEILSYGKGTVGILYADLFSHYAAEPKSGTRVFMEALLQKLWPDQMVRVEGSHLVDVVLRRKNGVQYLHLINMGGPHGSSQVVYDEIPPLHDLKITVRLTKAPQAVRLLPEGAALSWTYQQGELQMTLPKLEIYDMISIEE